MPGDTTRVDTLQSQSNTTEVTSPRPIIISIICVFFVGTASLSALWILLSPNHVGVWYLPYVAFLTGVTLVCMVGLWTMRRWAAFTFCGLVVSHQIVMWSMGVWNIFVLLIPAIACTIIVSQVSKMK